ncbi:MAG: hypothetical protein CMJ88_04585 [Planctomycetes bacterium]|nr:hypothetical protein [Planctomycetota bacterium]
MSKSIWSILAIGASGMILLSLMMQQYVGGLSERDRSPYAAAIETRMGSKLIGSVRVQKHYSGDAADEFSFSVTATVVAGVDKRKLAEAAGRDLWLGSMRAGERPTGVEVIVYEEGEDASSEAFRVSSPSKQR